MFSCAILRAPSWLMLLPVRGSFRLTSCFESHPCYLCAGGEIVTNLLPVRTGVIDGRRDTVERLAQRRVLGQAEDPWDVRRSECAVGRDRDDRDEGLHADLFGEMAGIAVERDDREHVVVINGSDQGAGRLSPGCVGGDGNQGNPRSEIPTADNMGEKWGTRIRSAAITFC